MQSTIAGTVQPAPIIRRHLRLVLAYRNFVNHSSSSKFVSIDEAPEQQSRDGNDGEDREVDSGEPQVPSCYYKPAVAPVLRQESIVVLQAWIHPWTVIGCPLISFQPPETPNQSHSLELPLRHFLAPVLSCMFPPSLFPSSPLPLPRHLRSRFPSPLPLPTSRSEVCSASKSPQSSRAAQDRGRR